jgi:serine/threonine protein kinase
VTVQGRFHILSRIKEGGMGAVVQAVDLLTNTIVALKYCLKPDDERRFAREVRIVQQINHPNVMGACPALHA